MLFRSWEMLGFANEPAWWQSVYGPAPYTSDNLIMWDDLSQGLVKEPGKPIVILTKFARPILKLSIPVDSQGNLVSPLEAGLSAGPITASIAEDFVFGDINPVENAWRKSSYYPYDLMVTLA